MSHAIVASMGNQQIELYIAIFGGFLGAIIGMAWENHREVSTLIIGFALAMALGQSMAPWAESYVWLVEYRPLAAKPWYFLVSMVIVVNVVIPLMRLVRTRSEREVPWILPR